MTCRPSCNAAGETMADPTPTRQLVREVLRKADCPLTPSHISTRVDRSLRSIRTALRELETDGEVTWRLDVNDARRRLYALAGEDADPGASVDRAHGRPKPNQPRPDASRRRSPR